MLRSLACVIAAVIVCFAMGHPVWADSLVTNGGFETGNLTGWNVAQAPDGKGLLYVSGFTHAGDFAVGFGAWGSTDDSIMQTLATTAGESYIFSFWVAHNLTDPTNDFSAYWNGHQVLNLVNASAFGWTQYSFTETASGPTSTIQFSGREVPAFYYLDDVSVIDNGATSVPEPSTLVALIGVGSMGVVGLVWRRRRG